MQWLPLSLSTCSRAGGLRGLGIFLDQAVNRCLPHWQADSLPLSHQGSPQPCVTSRSLLSLISHLEFRTHWYLAGNRAQVQIWEMEEKSVDT